MSNKAVDIVRKVVRDLRTEEVTRLDEGTSDDGSSDFVDRGVYTIDTYDRILEKIDEVETEMPGW